MAWFKTYHAIQSWLTINDKWYLILLKILATEADHLKKRDKTDLKMTYCPLCMLLSSKFEISFSVTNLQTEAGPLSPFLKDKKIFLTKHLKQMLPEKESSFAAPSQD